VGEALDLVDKFDILFHQGFQEAGAGLRAYTPQEKSQE